MPNTPRPASRSTSPTGLQLDASDPGDARIMRRQQSAARTAGRQRQSRDRVTRGRTDLEQAYDAGADEDEQDEPAADTGGRSVRKSLNSAGAPLSRGSWSPTLRPPTRARDAGGLLAGLLLYTGAIVYIRYGPAGWKGWLSAKFLNKPMQGLPSKSGGPAVSTEVR